MTSEELMRVAIESLARGNPEPYETALHDNVTWRAPAPPDEPESDGVRLGRDSVVELLDKTAQAMADFHAQWHARDIVSRGDIVWGSFDSEDGAEHLVRWRMQDGKIIHARTFR